MRSQNDALPSRSSVTTFSALSSSRLPTITDCSRSSAEGSALGVRRDVAGRGPAAIVFLRGVPGVLSATCQRRLGDLLARSGAVPRGRERFRRLGYGSAPWLARIAVAEAACCGTLRKTQAGARKFGKHRRRSHRDVLHGRGGAPHGPTMRDDCSWAAAIRRREYGATNVQPAAPARQLLQDVGAHQPDEAGSRKPPQQAAQRIDGVARAEHRLDRAGDDAAAIGEAARGRQPLIERRHAALRLQRIAGRHQQPDLIEPQPPPCQLDDVAMACVRRIERTAEQADAHAPSVAEARDRLMPERRVQGRTCPVPITR